MGVGRRTIVGWLVVLTKRDGKKRGLTVCLCALLVVVDCLVLLSGGGGVFDVFGACDGLLVPAYSPRPPGGGPVEASPGFLQEQWSPQRRPVGSAPLPAPPPLLAAAG